jgi:hypothetical protein
MTTEHFDRLTQLVKRDSGKRLQRSAELRIEYLPTQQLRQNPQNPRLHSDRQIKQIAASMEAHGFNMPIAINAEKQVVAGNGRLEAAKQLGLQTVPTLTLDHLTVEQQLAFAIQITGSPKTRDGTKRYWPSRSNS